MNEFTSDTDQTNWIIPWCTQNIEDISKVKKSEKYKHWHLCRWEVFGKVNECVLKPEMFI